MFIPIVRSTLAQKGKRLHTGKEIKYEKWWQQHLNSSSLRNSKSGCQCMGDACKRFSKQFQVSVPSFAGNASINRVFVCISPFSTKAELQTCIAHKQIPNNWLTDHAHFNHFTNQLHSHQRHSVHTLHRCSAALLCVSYFLALCSLFSVSLPIYYYNSRSFNFSHLFVLCNVCAFGFVGDKKSYWCEASSKGSE